MDEVSGPVVAVGLVLTAVFVPCVFISGIIGQFFRQFAVTIAVSTLISAFNSLTLSPALCALLLKPRAAGGAEALPRPAFALFGGALGFIYLTPLLAPYFQKLAQEVQIDAHVMPWLVKGLATLVGAFAGWLVRKEMNIILGFFFRKFNEGFEWLTVGYIGLIRVLLSIGVLVLIGYGGLLVHTQVFQQLPTGFIPAQDKGYLLVNVQLPDAASLGRTDAVLRQIEEIAMKTDGVKHAITVSGQSILLGANSSNFGSAYIMLDKFENRTRPELYGEAIAARLQAEFKRQITGAVINVFGAPPVDGLGTAGGFKIVIQDTGSMGLKILQEVGDQVVMDGQQADELQGVYTGFRADTPWLYLELDRVAAQQMGVTMDEITNSLQAQFGSLYVNDFNRFGRTWQVNLQAEGKFRKTPDDLKRLRVCNIRGEMVPLAGVLHLKEIVGPVLIQRYNLYPSVTISNSPAPGVSSGQAIEAMENVAQQHIPAAICTEWTELAYLQLQTADTATRAFILAVVLVFLVLAAQYESWALPLAVILVVPMCLLSSGVGVMMAGMDVNIFTQVGFVVLVGLACKNAILIVEFGRTRRMAGVPRKQAILEACRLRLRPIIMTSLAFVFGVLPLVVAEGAGAGCVERWELRSSQGCWV